MHILRSVCFRETNEQTNNDCMNKCGKLQLICRCSLLSSIPPLSTLWCFVFLSVSFLNYKILEVKLIGDNYVRRQDEVQKEPIFVWSRKMLFFHKVRLWGRVSGRRGGEVIKARESSSCIVLDKKKGGHDCPGIAPRGVAKMSVKDLVIN